MRSSKLHALVFCATLSAAPALATEVVTFDRGGNSYFYTTDIERFNRTGERVEIRGDCMSACTLYLGVKNVCVTPEATFWFHSAAGRDANFDLPDAVNYHPDSPIFRRYLPLKIWKLATAAGWLRRPGFNISADLTGRDMIGLGVPACRK